MKLVALEANNTAVQRLVCMRGDELVVLQTLLQKPLNVQEKEYYEKDKSPRFICSLSFYREYEAEFCFTTLAELAEDYRRQYADTPNDSTGAGKADCTENKVLCPENDGNNCKFRERPDEEGVYAAWFVESNVGCEHFIQRHTVRCETCGKCYTCPYCHNVCENHEFEFASQICCECGFEEQRFGTHCEFCNFEHGECMCAECCILFPIGAYEHCAKCSFCCSADNIILHKCGRDSKDDVCPVCLEALWQNKPLLGGSCGHLCHKICIEHLDSIKCPLCQKTNLTPEEKEDHLSDALLHREHFAPRLFCIFKCHDCQKEGCAIDISDIFCQHCGFINCERLRKATYEQYSQYKEGFPHFIELRRPSTFEDACSHIDDVDMQVELLVRSYTVRTRAGVYALFDDINIALDAQGYFK